MGLNLQYLQFLIYLEKECNRLISLIRFHAVTEDGSPWLDMSHIVSTLNKLDAGTLEKV